jgi:hypothetical protein
MAPRAFADAYVEITNRGAYGELAALFAPEAVFLAPRGKMIRGREAIRQFYVEFLNTITPQIRISSYVEQGNECVYELEARTAGEADFRLGAIDHATFDENGQVIRFAVFTKN